MAQSHHFELQSQLTDIAAGDGKLMLSTGTVDYGVPAQFGGAPGKASPEELILGALSACFSMTLGFVFEKRGIPIDGFAMKAACVVDRIERQLQLTSITLTVQVALQEDSAQIRADVQSAIERAERACLISNAIRGNVQLTIETEFN